MFMEKKILDIGPPLMINKEHDERRKKNQNLISTIKFYVSVSISFDFLQPSVLFFFDTNPFKN